MSDITLSLKRRIDIKKLHVTFLPNDHRLLWRLRNDAIERNLTT